MPSKAQISSLRTRGLEYSAQHNSQLKVGTRVCLWKHSWRQFRGVIEEIDARGEDVYYRVQWEGSWKATYFGAKLIPVDYPVFMVFNGKHE